MGALVKRTKVVFLHGADRKLRVSVRSTYDFVGIHTCADDAHTHVSSFYEVLL